jgi:hypothetical protein
VKTQSPRTSETRRITWEQFARAVKLLVAVTWGTLELWQWGGRPYPLAFIGAVLAGTEGAQLWLKLRTAADG